MASAKNFLSVPHEEGDHFHFVHDGMKGLSGQVLREAVLGCFCSLVLVTQQLQQQKQLQPNRWRVSAACEYCGRLVALLFGCRWWWWWVSGGGGWSVLASPYA